MNKILSNEIFLETIQDENFAVPVQLITAGAGALIGGARNWIKGAGDQNARFQQDQAAARAATNRTPEQQALVDARNRNDYYNRTGNDAYRVSQAYVGLGAGLGGLAGGVAPKIFMGKGGVRVANQASGNVFARLKAGGQAAWGSQAALKTATGLHFPGGRGLIGAVGSTTRGVVGTGRFITNHPIVAGAGFLGASHLINQARGNGNNTTAPSSTPSSSSSSTSNAPSNPTSNTPNPGNRESFRPQQNQQANQYGTRDSQERMDLLAAYNHANPNRQISQSEYLAAGGDNLQFNRQINDWLKTAGHRT